MLKPFNFSRTSCLDISLTRGYSFSHTSLISLLKTNYCPTGNEYPAMVEFAPFQKIPKRSSGRKRDARCATIEQDADYKAFLESLANPESVTLPPLEALLEEIQEQDRLLKGEKCISCRNCYCSVTERI